MLMGCSEENSASQNSIEVNELSEEKIENEIPKLHSVISYEEALNICNLPNVSGITLSNDKNNCQWFVSNFGKGFAIECRVNAIDGDLISNEKYSLPELPGEEPKHIPLNEIKIGERAAVNTALNDERVIEWYTEHENGIIEKVSLEGTDYPILWRISFEDKSSFSLLSASVNASSGEIISVRGMDLGGIGNLMNEENKR